MRNKNIVLFSSGISENSGLLSAIYSALSEKGYNCAIWRNLFANANDPQNIALLPTLIKKIPSFDYAILICEGHDITTMIRGSETTQVNTMRDNVLFEIGLCSMALGLDRTILVTDKDVRLPDDLVGVNHKLALKRIVIPTFCISSENSKKSSVDIFYAESIAEQIDEYITGTKDTLHQVVIGAASSTACGYVNNFIFRTLEHIRDGICINMENGTEVLHFPLSKIYMHIILPSVLDETTFSYVFEKKKHYLKGCVPTARSRAAYFDYILKDNELHIIDYPTTTSTSYNVAKIIMEIDADDSFDENASKRFTSKEINLFEATLKRLLNEQYLNFVIEQNYPALSDSEKAQIHADIFDIISNRLSIERIELSTPDAT